MPEFCSCGAQLPEDARFCHKCGKPQRDIPVVVETPPIEIRLEAPVPQLAPSFRHPVALRTGLLVSAIATLLCLAFPYGFVVWLPAAGFIAVYLFGRRTGQSLSVRNGARMGWIAGVLGFVIATILLTAIATIIANTPGSLDQLREQLNARAVNSEDVDKALQILGDPQERTVFFLQFLLFWFMFSVSFCTVGGALGAKVLAKD